MKFQVTYFTSGLSWSADYVLIANAQETEMSFDGYVQVYNNSGEEYENAQVRLVVGVVNLVEKIQDLLLNQSVYDAITRGDDPRRIAEDWRVALESFQALRQKYLIYK